MKSLNILKTCNHEPSPGCRHSRRDNFVLFLLSLVSASGRSASKLNLEDQVLVLPPSGHRRGLGSTVSLPYECFSPCPACYWTSHNHLFMKSEGATPSALQFCSESARALWSSPCHDTVLSITSVHHPSEAELEGTPALYPSSSTRQCITTPCF